MDWLEQWNKALEKVQCTNGNLVCINHFEEGSYEIKSKKYSLKKFTVPTVFTETINTIQVLEDQAIECQSTKISECSKCADAEKEVQFLRQCLAGMESEKEAIEHNLKMSIDTQLEQIKTLTEKVRLLEEVNAKFQTDFARFIIDDNSEVSKHQNSMSNI